MIMKCLQQALVDSSYKRVVTIDADEWAGRYFEGPRRFFGLYRGATKCSYKGGHENLTKATQRKFECSCTTAVQYL